MYFVLFLAAAGRSWTPWCTESTSLVGPSGGVSSGGPTPPTERTPPRRAAMATTRQVPDERSLSRQIRLRMISQSTGSGSDGSVGLLAPDHTILWCASNNTHIYRCSYRSFTFSTIYCWNTFTFIIKLTWPNERINSHLKLLFLFCL